MRGLWSYVERRRRSGSYRDDASRRRTGRVLRVKDGYNPNSSSIGSSIPGYLMFAVASGGLTVLLLNLLDVTGNLLRKQSDASPPPVREPPGDDAEPEAQAPRAE